MRPAAVGPAPGCIAKSSNPSFIERMTVCCDHLVREWLQNREVWDSVPSKIRTRIVDTVRHLILKRAYPDTSLKRIAQLARVTEGSIYRLFETRMFLNEYVLRDTHEKVLEVTRKLLSQRSLAEVSLKDVAQAMNLPEAEIAILFPSMEALLDHVLGSSKAT